MKGVSTLSVIFSHFLAKYLTVPSAVGNRQSAIGKLLIEDYFRACLVLAIPT
ncbi:hypothetical protein KsCSTR_09260 [Candidatus Kuenenia stuttgartiensis]|uniref:Uncharacterized protein n=1 Tax=Kuenenia stuttgartiensis TaxID=174633 RepID=Q1PZ23_KUEST|nr:hypothetical protein KsCSTR_09260 [Candidatus Kuenenia stuttgartiensis]CAJ72330.1 unknown protein [Candidatus Kuenenia stuttgartiensis]